MTNPTADAPERATRAKTRRADTTGAPSPARQASTWQEPCRGVLYSVREVVARVNYDMETEGIAKLLADLAYNELGRLLDIADGQDVWADPSDIDFAVRNGPLVMLTAANLLNHLTTADDPSQRLCELANLALAEEWLTLLTKTVVDLPGSINTLCEIRDGHRLMLSEIRHSKFPAPAVETSARGLEPTRQAVITSSIIELLDWVDVVEQNYDQGPRFETIQPVLFERIATLGSAILSASNDDTESTFSIRSRVDAARGSRGEMV